MFVDPSGRRAVVCRVAGTLAGSALLACLVGLGLSVMGVSWVPSVDLPLVGTPASPRAAADSWGSDATPERRLLLADLGPGAPSAGGATSSPPAVVAVAASRRSALDTRFEATASIRTVEVALITDLPLAATTEAATATTLPESDGVALTPPPNTRAQPSDSSGGLPPEAGGLPKPVPPANSSAAPQSPGPPAGTPAKPETGNDTARLVQQPPDLSIAHPQPATSSRPPDAPGAGPLPTFAAEPSMTAKQAIAGPAVPTHALRALPAQPGRGG